MEFLTKRSENLKVCRTGRRGRRCDPTQNIENNPMQSRMRLDLGSPAAPVRARNGAIYVRGTDLISSGSEIVDALDAGRGHRRPGGIERARQIDGPASGLDQHGVEAEPAGVDGRIMHAKIGG